MGSTGLVKAGIADTVRDFGAGVILPKRLLAAALAGGGEGDFNHLLRDNYESSSFSPVVGGNDVELKTLSDIFQLSVADFVGARQEPGESG